MLQEYKQQKEELLAKYDKLLELDIFPVESYLQNAKPITKEDVLEKKKQLQDEQFLVSITGQTNAGKSTLINALIFRDEVLPADPAPHTAKITILKYADKPSIEITFYNKAEWEKVKNIPEFEQFLKGDIEKAIQNGVLPNSVIFESSKTIKDEIENLTKYVSAKSNFTPYVKQVDVYYPSDVLKEVSIVDTPGTEDPNPIRGRVTKEWIDKTHANIYAIYAGQAFNDKDFEFLDKYLLHVPKEQKITVLNKIDTLTDEASLKSYIQNNILDDENMKLREIAQKDSLTYVSSLGALIDRMLLDKKELDDNLEEYADKLEGKGFLEDKKHNFSTLEKMIEQKLMSNKGAKIIHTHTTYIGSLFERKEEYFKEKIDIENSHINDMDISKEEIAGKIQTIKEIKDKFESGLKLVEQNIERLNHEKGDDILLSINHIYNNEKNKILSLVDGYNKSDFKSNTQTDILWRVKDSLGYSFGEIRHMIEGLENDVKENISNHLLKLKQDINMINSSNGIDLSFMGNFEQIANIGYMEERLKSVIDNELSKDRLIAIYETHKSWFWTTQDDVGKMRNEVKNAVQTTFENIKSTLKNYIADGLQSILNSKKSELEGSVKPVLIDKDMELRNLQSNFNEKEEMINKKKELIVEYETKLKEIQSLKTQIEG